MSVHTDTLNHAVDHNLLERTQWKLDPSHTTVQFSVRHLISRVSGTFSAVEGTLHQGKTDLTESAVDIAIDINSINTNIADRNTHLKGPDFFDAGNHPKMLFGGSKFVPTGEGTFDIIGNLTIRGTALPVVLHATDTGRAKDAWGNLRAGFSASTTINRSDFGLTWNMALEAGGVMVGEQVRIEIDAQFVWQGSN